jgi:nucleotide-binding universal stress UspA family protein
MLVISSLLFGVSGNLLYVEELVQRVRTFLDPYKKKLQEMHHLDSKIVAVFGDPREKLLEEADKEGVDVIVMGSHGMTAQYPFHTLTVDN